MSKRNCLFFFSWVFIGFVKLAQMPLMKMYDQPEKWHYQWTLEIDFIYLNLRFTRASAFFWLKNLDVHFFLPRQNLCVFNCIGSLSNTVWVALELQYEAKKILLLVVSFGHWELGHLPLCWTFIFLMTSSAYFLGGKIYPIWRQFKHCQYWWR